MIKIAIVEDDLAIVQMYRLKFEAEGFEVQTASNGKLGLEMIQAFAPDMVLLDLMMPVMNGDQMLVQMRAESWGKDIRVVVLTNMGKEEVPKTLMDQGVDDIIIKADMTPRQVAELVKNKLKG